MRPYVKMLHGCPGSGKTHTLLLEAEALCKKHGGRTLIITHTNSVVAELKRRLRVGGVVVSTIHSLANQLAGFGNNGEGRAAQTDGTRAYVKATGLPTFAVIEIEKYLAGIETPQNTALYEAMLAWCRTNGIPHFGAMLREAIRQQEARQTIQFAAVCIDEFQDITPPQWRFIRAVYAPARDVVMAGDDDQSLYAWADATPEDMFAERDAADENRILAQSYRCPRAVQVVSERLIAQVRERVNKTMRPRDAEGQVFKVREYSQDWGTTLMHAVKRATDEHPVLVLARSNAILRDASDRLMTDKIPYDVWGPLPHAKQIAPVSIALGIKRRAWLRELTENDYAQVARWRGRLEAGDQSQWATAWNHPMARRSRLAWDHTAATLDQPPKIILSTIHSAKGREADTVVLLADLPTPSKRALEQRASEGSERDAEIRAWYVGVTRARETLIIATHKGNPLLEHALRS